MRHQPEDAMRRARRDPAAFADVYEQHARAVHAYLVRRVGRDAADDLLSDVFVAAFDARHRFRPHASGSPLPWLYGIARNCVHSHLRRRTIAGPGPERADVDWAAVDARLDASALAGQLRAALDGLSDVEREMLLLTGWEQLTVTEAAAVLNISPTAARSRLHRARAHAAAALGVTEGDLA